MLHRMEKFLLKFNNLDSKIVCGWKKRNSFSEFFDFLFLKRTVPNYLFEESRVHA